METTNIDFNYTKRNSNRPCDVPIGHKKEFLIDALHVFALFNFAFAQPLYSLLSANAEFFVARHSKSMDIIILMVVASVGLPAILVFAEWLVGFFGRSARKILHACVIGLLISIIFMPALKKVDINSGRLLVLYAILIGGAVTLTYVRFRPVRVFFSVLSFSIVIFPGLFLFNSPVLKVVFPDDDPSAIPIQLTKTPPIVMVIFDEFPVTSLMNAQYRMDSILYPNFFELASKAYWYRNCKSVSEETLKAIPCLLSGLEPSEAKKLPSSIYYPHNLFTLLGRAYDMKVIEPYTEVCPKSICSDRGGEERFNDRIKSLFLDVSVVYLHILLPPDFSRDLPAITQDWKMFWATKHGQDALNSDRVELFNDFADSIVSRDNPTLYFIHTVIPHIPWEYLPSEKKYIDRRGIPGLDVKKELWGENEWLVVQGYQRHLLQVGFADTLLGKIIDKLKKMNMYDRTLLIVTADHGANFLPGRTRRGVLTDGPNGVFSVPLFIKAPYQDVGKIIDDETKTCDIFPTICDILDIDVPWHFDGKSGLPESLTSGNDIRKGEKKINREIVDTVKRKTEIFGYEGNPDRLHKIGNYKHLIGKSLGDIRIVSDQGTEVQFDQGLIFENVKLGSRLSPCWITGDIYSIKDMKSNLSLAIAINGTIKGVTEAFNVTGKQGKFMAMVPESAFRTGRNRVEAYTISEADGSVVLRNAANVFKRGYSLRINDRGREEIVRISDGVIIPVVAKAVSAHLEVARLGKDSGINEVGSDNCIFGGWAADLENSNPAEAILVFGNGKFIFSGKPNMDRPGVMKYFNNPKLKKTGFDFMVPLRLLKNEKNIHVRLFAVSEEGVATEFFYPKGYMWAGK